MDQINPIIPHSPTPAPVAPAPRAEAINRDGARSGGQPQQQPQRRRKPAVSPVRQLPRDVDPDAGDAGDDGHPHIDITV